MGLFDLFGKSFDQQVQDAINEVGATTPGVSGLRADVRGKVITLKGAAESRKPGDAEGRPGGQGGQHRELD